LQRHRPIGIKVKVKVEVEVDVEAIYPELVEGAIAKD
jgi:hypothetical protein